MQKKARFERALVIPNCYWNYCSRTYALV